MIKAARINAPFAKWDYANCIVALSLEPRILSSPSPRGNGRESKDLCANALRYVPKLISKPAEEKEEEEEVERNDLIKAG